MKHRIEGGVEGDKRAMLQSYLGREDTVPRIAVIPVEACCELGMQVGDGKGLQTAGTNSGTQFLWLEVELFQAHLVVQFVEGHCADEDGVCLVLDQRSCLRGQAITADRPPVDGVAVEKNFHCVL